MSDDYRALRDRSDPLWWLNRICAQNDQLKKDIEAMSAALDRLTQEVAQTRDVTNSAVTLISGLADQIRNAVNTGDDAALQQLADDLDSAQANLAAAIAANTPASTPPGGGGADTSTGGQGTDTVTGGGGADTTGGGAGSDTTGGGQASDTTGGGQASDTVSGGQADDGTGGTPVG